MSQDTEPEQARQQKLASFFNVFDHSELWLQIRALDRLDSVEDAEPVQPVTRTRQRRPSLTTALAQAAKAGLTVSGATIAPDGSVTLKFGDGSTVTNPWDEVLTNAAH